MADIAVVRANERIRAGTGQIHNLAAALFGALVRLWSKPELSFEVVVWPLGSLALIFVGHGLYGLLEDED